MNLYLLKKNGFLKTKQRLNMYLGTSGNSFKTIYNNNNNIIIIMIMVLPGNINNIFFDDLKERGRWGEEGRVFPSN